MNRINIPLATDSYKLGHHRMMPDKTEYIYSYYESRSGSEFPYTQFFGLQSFLALLSQHVTKDDVDYAEAVAASHFGMAGCFNRTMWDIIVNEHDGYLPLEIKAVPEGSVVPTNNVLMTVVNTDPRCSALTNHVETILCQLWYPCNTATITFSARQKLRKILDETGCDRLHADFMLHDFGYRGASSIESAGIGGAGQLINFMGTDTLAAIEFIRVNYGIEGNMPGFSVMATEHSVMTALGRAGEFDVVQSLLDKFPTGILSVVSDSYDIYEACRQYGTRFKAQILSRDGKFVVRPDCYSDDTSILTDSGWKFFNQLSHGDLVAQVEDDGTHTFVKPTEIINEHYEGDMYEFKDFHGKVDLLVTPDHRMIHRKDNKWEVEYAKDIKYYHKKKLIRSSAAKNKGRSLTSLERLLVAFQADGSYPSRIPQNEGSISGHKCIRFNFAKERKLARLVEICKQGGFKHKISDEPSRPNQKTIYIWLDKDSVVPKDFSWVKDYSCSNWCAEFIEELSHWDSSIRNEGRIKFDTTNYDVVPVVELIAQSAGYGVLISSSVDSRKPHFSDVYTLHILKSNEVDGQSVTKTKVNYKGTVYCVKVPTGRVVVKRNRSVLVCGNSGNPIKVTLKCLRILGEFFGTTKNSKGFKELPKQIGMIWGDGIIVDDMIDILDAMALKGWAANNIVFGMGGGLLQRHNRDTQRFAFKCSANCIDGEWYPVFKDPIEGGKTSKKGMLKLDRIGPSFRTISAHDNAYGYGHCVDHMRTVFKNGNILVHTSFDDIRKVSDEYARILEADGVMV